MPRQLIKAERFTSIQEAQAGLSRLLERADRERSFYRVLRNNKPIGILLSNKTWDSLLEDIEALSSPRYLNSIDAARRERKTYSSRTVKRLLKIR